MTAGVVGVHVGAGYHSVADERSIRDLCARACLAAHAAWNRGFCAQQAALAAMVVLEDSPRTNAANGSNLNAIGRVECDASCMIGSTGSFGAVGAVSGVKNPILLADAIRQKDELGRLDFGLVPPMLLAGEGARQFASDHGLDVCDEAVIHDYHVTENAKAAYENYQRMMVTKHGVDESVMHDTVGVVCRDANGCMYSAVSSGGVALKHPGRIGEAAMFGAGCWADATTAVSVSGTGEHIMKSLLAFEASSALMRHETAFDALSDTLSTGFLDHGRLRHLNTKMAGVIALRWDGAALDCVWGHTTESFCIGYMTSSSTKPVVRMSRMPTTLAGRTMTVEGVRINFPPTS